MKIISNLLLCLCLSFLLMPKTWAQELAPGVIQQTGADNIKVEFEAHTYLFPPAPSDPTLRTWVAESHANASNGMGIRADGGSANGGDPFMMSKVKFDIYFDTPGDYYLYLRVLAPDVNSNSLCIPTGFNKPICTEFQIPVPDPFNFQWIELPLPFNVPMAEIGDVFTLPFFPFEEDLLIDQMVLHQMQGLLPAQLDLLGLTPQQLPLPPQGVIGLSTFEGLPWELQIGASQNIDSGVAFPGVDEDFFPYVGLQFLHMDQQDNSLASGNSNVTFNPIDISCYPGSDIELCFRWIAPAAFDDLFGLGDVFTVNVAYFDGATPLLPLENLLLVNGVDINTQGLCYQQTCTILTVPASATNFVLTFDLISDDPLADIWLDQVSLETTSPMAPRALMTDCMLAGPDLDVEGFNSENVASYTWVINGSVVSGPSPTATTLSHTFTANGTYLVCLIVLDACFNAHIDCKEITITGFLPIELIAFDAKKEKEDVMLYWSTQSETNNSHFILEHSVNGRDFAKLGRVEGAGDANTLQEYQYQHDKPGAGTHYYRLLQVDFDGQSEYSEIISVRFDAKPDVVLFPNPFSDWINVTNELPRAYLQFKLYDVNGRLLLENRLEGANGFDLSFLNTGVYLAKILDENGDTIQHERIVKSN